MGVGGAGHGAGVADAAGSAVRADGCQPVRHSQHGDFPIRVEKVDPPKYLAYRWVSAFPGEDLREDNSTLVEFTLTPEGDGTRLRVVESGFAALPTSEENRRNVINDHTPGWEQCLAALAARAE